MEPRFDFGEALGRLKHGYPVCRAGWNGKGMWIEFVNSGGWNLDPRTSETLGLPCAPFIVMKTADGNLVPWLASQTDILAEDWQLVPDEAR